MQVMISRMFAEFEQRKKQMEERDANLKKKAKEEQVNQTPSSPISIGACRTFRAPAPPSTILARTRLQAEREFMEALKKREEKMWEKSRQKRINGWYHTTS